MPAPESRKTLFLSLVIWLTASATDGGRHVDDHVDAVGVVPLAGDGRADVGLVLVVGRDELDLDARLSMPEVLDGHRARDDRAGAREVGVEAGHVVQHADLDRRCRRSARARAAQVRDASASRLRFSAFIGCSP